MTKSKLENRAIDNERHVILQESDEVDKMYDEVVFDHLHAVAFKTKTWEELYWVQGNDQNHKQTGFSGLYHNKL